mmetsp:Transcript_124156/g.218602  ORF Transcript_124156/g.218602 Transcript_124156/m.218602 type:complete len:286 (-) Transcript_124156:5-862(-)
MVNASPLTAKCEIHTCKYVFGQIQGFCCLRYTTLLHHLRLVHDIWVPIMHACPKNCIGALQDGPECHLCRSSHITYRPNVAGDVLGKPNNLLGVGIAALFRSKFPKHTRQKKHLLKVSPLVGINALRKSPTHEWNCMILIVALPITQYGIPWKLNTISGLLPAVRQVFAIPINQATVVAAPLHRMHKVHVGIGSLQIIVNECNFQTIRELLKHSIGVIKLFLVETLVHLHRHQASEAITRIPDTWSGEDAPTGTTASSLHLVMTLQSWVVHAHSCHSTPQSLHAH